jgi:uncharacterized protein YidB (DUF937 family)
MPKTKSIRAKIGDAEIMEQAARELAVKFERTVSSNEIIHALVSYLPKAIDDMYAKEVKS